MKNICILCFAILFIQNLGAQSCGINYEYDAAGNRKKRFECQMFASGSDERTPATGQEQSKALQTEAGIMIVPNPGPGIFRLESSKVPATAQVAIINTLGAVVNRRTFDDGIFDLSTLPAGTYFVQVRFDDQRQTLKLQKTSN